MAIIPIFPKRNPINLSRADRALQNALNMTAEAIRVDLRVTTQTWNNKPQFTIDKRPFERDIYTNDEVYAYVNYGTRPHKIRAKNAPRLAFQWGGPGSYKPKTVPNRILSRSGGATGTMHFMTEVNHPGTKARRFTHEIARKWTKEAPRQMQRAIASAFT